jgi:protein-L-isoaspartate(D-aspartate) O-methyltransferase
MELVDRQYFTSHSPYQDSPQPIGYGATISAPHMHAYALEFLYDKLKTANNVLDVGSGTGYLTAAMALIAPS